MSYDLSLITSIISDRLKAHANTKGFTIRAEEEVSMDTNNYPWLGIYKGSLSIDPRSIGKGSRNKRLTGVIRLFLKVASSDTKTASNKMDENLSYLLDALDDEYERDKFNSKVSNWNGYDVDYDYDVDDESTMYIQTASITLRFELII